MNCVILQPSYIPWRGYFHQIARADVFVFYDDVKYDKNGWRNRNRIKTPSGAQWLTIPVYSQGIETQHTPINQICVDWKQNWAKKHWHALQTNYARAPFFTHYTDLLRRYYSQHPEYLANFTIDLTIALAHELGITWTHFVRASELQGIQGTKTDRLVAILTGLGATHYISGPSAQDYLEEEKLAQAGISLEFMTYDYREYPQIYPPYDPQVTVLDLMFNTGPEALSYITG